MKKLWFFLLAGCFLGCTQKQELSLTLQITSQPQGGQYVTTLSCTFEAYTMEVCPGGGIRNVRVLAYWMTAQGNHKETEYSFGPTPDPISYTTTFSAPPGMFLDKTFWVEFHWQDANGSHVVKSQEAVCIVP
ncbi:MAG: hypothetical protein ABIL25_05480 [candidate division WOR-3 bacterium]